MPVYEIYKAGEPAHWAEGLDVLSHLDLRVALVPHYDNAEGGTHDTRFCYLGERRLRLMERDLPAGTTLSLTELRALAHRGDLARTIPQPRRPERAAATVSEITAACERRFDDALTRGDAQAMAACVLDLEATVHAWSSDTELDDGAEQARAVLRTLILRLGQAATKGLRDPAERLRPLVEPLLAVRADLCRRRDFGNADAVRAALAAGGVEVRDNPDGATWQQL